MIKIFTLDQNIQLTPSKSKKLKLFIDSEISKIETINLEPSELTIKQILSYSQALSTHKTKNTGVVNVILN